MKTLPVSAYKSPKKDELFIYVLQSQKMDELPNELVLMFGEPIHVINFDLTKERRMPRCDVNDVIMQIEKRGYYMQMPPTEIEKAGYMTPPPERLDNIF